jgi:hypothetical protein
MRLTERLEKRARELDQQVRIKGWHHTPADDRELLLEAAAKICELETLVESATALIGSDCT